MLAVVAAIAAALGIALPGGSDSSTSSLPGSTSASQTSYPAEEEAAIAATLHAIDTGSANRYPEDGETFQNREGHLPSEPLGYYREYTVETPGSPDRGTRRLVVGDQGETYYTNDHYNSFTRIEPEDFDEH